MEYVSCSERLIRVYGENAHYVHKKIYSRMYSKKCDTEEFQMKVNFDEKC